MDAIATIAGASRRRFEQLLTDELALWDAGGTAKWAPPTLVTNWFIMSKRDIFWKMLMKPAARSRW
jgi:hypothetical protein